MERASNFRAGRNCVFLLHVHLVFVTKYRRKVFTKEILADLKNIFSSICNDFEATLVEMDVARSRSPSGRISSEDSSFKIGQFPKRGFVTSGSSAWVFVDYKSPLWWSIVVSQLFCRKLWGCTIKDYSYIH